MGTSTPLQYSAKMRLAEQAARGSGRAGTEAGALLLKRLVGARTPARLRGVGRRGSPLGVRYKVDESGPDITTALVFVTGKYQLIERDTRPHPIPRLASARSKTVFGPAFGGVNTRRKKPVVIGGQPYAQVFHPGTRGKHPFEKSVAESKSLIPRAYAASLLAEYRAIF